MSDIEGISEGRRQMALEKAEDARREWLRAERAEAEVAALRAEVERLRAALREIMDATNMGTATSMRGAPYLVTNVHVIARAALGEEKKG